MFYAAAVLILIGILIFIYSISIKLSSAPERKTGSSKPQTVNSEKNIPVPGPEESKLYDEMRSSAGHPASPAKKEKATEPSLTPKDPGQSSAKKEPEPEQTYKEQPDTKQDDTEKKPAPEHDREYQPEPAEKKEPLAVLYEDDSNSVDYSGPSSEIDSSLESYKNIRRIGEGILSSEKNGINFYVDRKLYRFDFHRINELYRGDDYIALRIADHMPVKLFISKTGEAGSEIKKIISDYKEYSGEVG